MSGEHAVGRVIARPFTGVPGAFERTDGRRDYALEPPSRSYLLELQDAGVDVHAVGKIDDLFAGVGVSVAHAAATNLAALDAVAEMLAGEHSLARGLVFANLIETDQTYGHRKDARGFAGALREIDARVGAMLARLREQDLLIVTADHGVDIAHVGSDHTREYAPRLAVSGAMLARGGKGSPMAGTRHDGPLADVGATAMRWLTAGDVPALPGEAFIS
jgi:phosphopentomutase